MVDTVKDKAGRIVAFCEWSLRDKLGLEDSKGEYIFFNDMWVHPDFRHRNVFNFWRKIIEPKVPTVRFIYWIRNKYKKDGKARLSKYTEKQVLKLRGV